MKLLLTIVAFLLAVALPTFAEPAVVVSIADQKLALVE